LGELRPPGAVAVDKETLLTETESASGDLTEDGLGARVRILSGRYATCEGVVVDTRWDAKGQLKLYVRRDCRVGEAESIPPEFEPGHDRMWWYPVASLRRIAAKAPPPSPSPPLSLIEGIDIPTAADLRTAANMPAPASFPMASQLFGGLDRQGQVGERGVYAAIKNSLLNAKTTDEVLRFWVANRNRMEPANFPHALSRLGRSVKEAGRQSGRRQSDSRARRTTRDELLSDKRFSDIMTELAQPDTIGPLDGPSHLFSIVIAFAQLALHKAPAYEFVYSAIMRDVTSKLPAAVPSLSMKLLARLAWALAKLGVRESAVWDAIGQEITDAPDQMNEVDYPFFVHAMGSVGYKNEAVLSLMADEALRRDLVSQLNPQGLSNVAWAHAKLGIHNGRLFQALGEQVISLSSRFREQEVGIIPWAFATLGYFDREVFRALGRAAVESKKYLTTQPAQVAWAFAAADMPQAHVFKAMAEEMVWQLDRYTAKQLSQVIWGYGKLDHIDQALLQKLTGAVLQKVSTFKMVDVMMTLQGLAASLTGSMQHHKLDALPLVDALAQSAVRCLAERSADVPPHMYINILRSLAEMRVKDEELLDLIAAIAYEQRQSVVETPAAFGRLIWAVRTLAEPQEGEGDEIEADSAAGRVLVYAREVLETYVNRMLGAPAAADGAACGSTPSAAVVLSLFSNLLESGVLPNPEAMARDMRLIDRVRQIVVAAADDLTRFDWEKLVDCFELFEQVLSDEERDQWFDIFANVPRFIGPEDELAAMREQLALEQDAEAQRRLEEEMRQRPEYSHLPKGLPLDSVVVVDPNDSLTTQGDEEEPSGRRGFDYEARDRQVVGKESARGGRR